MSFFVTKTVDEWGTSYSLTGAGYTALVVLILVLLLAAGLAGGFVGGRVFKNLSMTWLRRGFALLILYGGVKALL